MFAFALCLFKMDMLFVDDTYLSIMRLSCCQMTLLTFDNVIVFSFLLGTTVEFAGEIPPYMYGTHYSSAMIVVSYMVRIEPFTQQFLKLQVCTFVFSNLGRK